MKVLFVCSSQVSVPPQRGGAIEEIVFEIAKHIGKSIEPVIVSRAAFDYPGIRCLHIPSKIKKSKAAAILEDFFYGLKCAKKIREEKPDIVHLNTTFTSLGITLFLHGKYRPKIVYTSHSPAWTVPDEEIGLANRTFNGLEAFVMKHADKVTAVSESMRQGIIEKGGIAPEKVVTIPNFSRTEEFSPRLGRGWKKANRIDGPIVLFVGKLTETKGVRYLLEAVPLILQKHPKTTFILVGGLEHEQTLQDNPWRNLAQKLDIENRVKFLGTVSKEELPKIYASADVFVLPTMREGMPMVILEAAASGLPIVTTRVSGIPEAVDERAAVFVHRKDPRGLAYSVVRILSSPEKARKMGQAARRQALVLRKGVVLEKYLELYQALMPKIKG